MSYAALGNGESEGDLCPGKFEVWAQQDDGTGKFLWCADSCPSPWEKDIWMDTGQETCTMPWSDYQQMLAKDGGSSTATPSNGASQAGISAGWLALGALAVVGGTIWLMKA